MDNFYDKEKARMNNYFFNRFIPSTNTYIKVFALNDLYKTVKDVHLIHN